MTAVATKECPKCSGAGALPHFFQFNRGVCYTCHGDGKVTDVDDLIDQPNVSDHIFRLYKATDDVVTTFAFYVWDTDKTKQAYGTGSCVPHQFSKSGTELPAQEPDEQLHQPLKVIREYYRDLLKQGFKRLSDAEEHNFIQEHLVPYQHPLLDQATTDITTQ